CRGARVRAGRLWPERASRDRADGRTRRQRHGRHLHRDLARGRQISLVRRGAPRVARWSDEEAPMMRLRSHTMAPATTAYGETLHATGEFSLSARSVPSMCVPDDAWRREQRPGEDREMGKPMTTSIDPVETGVMASAALATSATVTT